MGKWTRGVLVRGPRTDLAPRTGTGLLAMPAGMPLRQLARSKRPQLMRLCQAGGNRADLHPQVCISWLSKATT